MQGDTYPPSTELVHRLRRALLDGEGRKVTFIVGSGASRGAVPDTDEMLDFFRSSLGTDQEDLDDFDAKLSSTPDNKKYQAAADFLINRAGVAKVNRAIRLAVLKARTPRISSETFLAKISDEDWMKELNKQYNNWVVPQGITALGQILALVPDGLQRHSVVRVVMEKPLPLRPSGNCWPFADEHGMGGLRRTLQVLRCSAGGMRPRRH